jgi:hypothetical protein
VSLEFVKVVEQVQTMGRYLGHRSQSQADRMALALERFYALTDLEPVRERIALVRASGVSGYRGATAAPPPCDEVLCGVGPAPPPPAQATILAVDGSQVYPDQHAAALYYLINVGLFVYYHGSGHLPDQMTQPELAYKDTLLLDRDGRLITNQTVNARRTLAEMRLLAAAAWDLRDAPRPLVALHDGGLLKYFGATDIADAQAVEQGYMETLQQLHDSAAVLAGYGDAPRSSSVISLLHLMSLPDDQVSETNLKTNGALEGLTDVALFAHVLEAGQRSALMVQNSPQNRDYKRRGDAFEIAFFYVNVAPGGRPTIVRIEVPLWVARDQAAIDALHALLVTQCAIQGRKHYPYALTRADELAYVSSAEKGELDSLIRIEMLKNQMQPETSNKLQTKGLARGSRRQHRLRR